MSWSDLSDWWLDEVGSDPACETVVTPLLAGVLSPVQGETYLDLGSGEGRVMQAVEASGASVHGVELNESLAGQSGSPSVVAQLPKIPIRDDSYDGAYSVLVLEHLEDDRAFFTETARVVRPGEYFSVVSTEVETGEGIVTFHHRT